MTLFSYSDGEVAVKTVTQVSIANAETSKSTEPFVLELKTKGLSYQAIGFNRSDAEQLRDLLNEILTAAPSVVFVNNLVSPPVSK